MRSLHANWVFVALIATGIVGLWGLTLALLRRPADRIFKAAAGTAAGVMILQVVFGLVAFSEGFRPGDDVHLFYGFVILFTFAFAYIYRSQIDRRPALSWGLLLLFIMGLGLRAWANVGT